VSEHSLPGYYRIEPIFAADRFSSFTGLDFFACFSGQFRNGTEGYSIHVSSKIISSRIRNKIFRFGLLGAVV